MWRLLPVLAIAVGCSTSADRAVTVLPTDSVAATSVTVPPATIAPGDDTVDTVDTVAPSPSVDHLAVDPVVVPTGFDRVAATVTAADGTVCEVCLWLAATPERRSLGLMGVTDLGAADGMAFRYDERHTTQFWMKNTLLPLSIAFFAADGAYLDAFDMEPCVTAVCERYPTPADFLVAVETVQGGLPELALLPGSALVLSDLPCGG